MNFLKLMFFLTLSVLFQNGITAQEWVSYQSEQQINDLVDTGDELLIATDAGLVVLNKSTLAKTTLNKSNSNLQSNHIQTITIAPDGMPWIGTYDAIMQRFNGTDFEDGTTPDSDEYNPNSTELYDLKIAPNGDFWLGTSDGIFQKENQDWLHYGEDELDASLFKVWDIEISANGDVFVASNHVYKFANGEWSNLTEDTEVVAYMGADLFFSSTGDLYLTGDLDKIGRYDGEEWESLSIDFNGSEVIRLTEDVDGNMYFNTARDGIFKLVDGIWIPQINAQTEAFNNETDYFYIDNENSHWLNNNIQLSVYNDSDLETITISNYTLETNNIKNIHKGENGLLYFITANNSEVAVLDTDGNWSVLSLPSSGASFESFRDILFLADNNIWLASNQGFYHYNGDSWIFNELINSSSIVADAEGGIYILFNGGILIIDNGVTTEYNVDNSPLANSIAIGHGVDADGNLWIASFDWDAGYAIQKVASDGTWTTYSKEDFPEVDKARGDFYFDANGNVWVSRGAFGAAKFDGTTWTNPFTGNTDEITNTDVQAIGSDANGKLYFAHQYGVTTLLDDEWDNLIIEEVPTNLSHSGTIQFNDAGTLWWASRSYGLFSYSLLGTNVVDFETQTISNLSIYPNPAVNYAMLDFTTKSNENVNISIYNNLGQLQSNLNLGKFTVGTFQERIEVAGFAKGFYTVQLEIGGQHFVERMVVQ